MPDNSEPITPITVVSPVTQVVPPTPVAPQNPTPTVPSTPGNPPTVEPTTNDAMEVEEPVYKQWSFWITLFLLLNLLVFGYLWIVPLFSPFIVIKEQPITAAFRVDKARVPEKGFVVIQADSGGTPGVVLGFSNFLIPDTYSDFNISVLSPPDLTAESLLLIKPGTKGYATLYKDVDNDSTFTEADREVVRDILGRNVQATFVITSTP